LSILIKDKWGFFLEAYDMKRLTSIAFLAVCTLATVRVIIFSMFGCESPQKQAGPREKSLLRISTYPTQFSYIFGFHDRNFDSAEIL